MSRELSHNEIGQVRKFLAERFAAVGDLLGTPREPLPEPPPLRP